MNQIENNHLPQESMTRMETLTNNKGMTLVELLVYVGLMSFTVLISATLIFNLFKTQNQVAKSQAISELSSRVINASRNPEYLRRSLSPLVPCIQNPATPCAATPTAAALPLQDLTAPAGNLCYNDKGAQGCACSNTCSIQVSTRFAVLCPGGSGRANCPANQAVVRIEYSIEPHPTFATTEKQFYPIRGIHTMKPDAIWGDTTQVAKGGRTSELKKGIFNAQTANCGTGSVLVGIREDGSPHCQNLTATCPTGHILGGYQITTTGSTYSFTPKCIDIRCPSPGGVKQVFAGIDPVTETPICRPLNPPNTECQALSGGFPTGRFMIGLDANSTPICRKKTCLPGEIFAGWDASGDARCVSTGFIPKCHSSSSPSCTPHSLAPPGPTYFYSATSGVALGFEGIPYISGWSSGAPTQGLRHAWKNWGDGVSSSTPNNIFFSTSDSRGGTKTFGSTNINCQYDASYASNLRCRHNWQYVTRQNGDCPADSSSTRYNYIGGNQCEIENFTCDTWEYVIPTPPVGGCPTCQVWQCQGGYPGGYSWKYGGTTQSEQLSSNWVNGTLSLPTFGGTGFTSSCINSEPHHSYCSPGSCGSVGTPVNSSYNNFVLVGGCNYVYTP